MFLQDIEAYLNTFTFTNQSKTYAVKRNQTPDDVAETITLIEFPAGPPIRAMGPSVGSPVREKCGLMVITRGPARDADAARDIAEQVHQKLDHFGGQLSGRDYFIQAMHAPILQEQDRSARWRYEANYVVWKTRG